MYKYSQKSLDKLYTTDLRLRYIFMKAIEVMDISILEGHRDEETQNHYYESGTSKLKWPHSKHNSNPSKAIDAVPYPIDYEKWKKDPSLLFYLGGLIQGIAHSLGYKIRWGRDWDSDLDFNDQTFNDFAHFELCES